MCVRACGKLSCYLWATVVQEVVAAVGLAVVVTGERMFVAAAVACLINVLQVPSQNPLRRFQQLCIRDVDNFIYVGTSRNFHYT